MKQQLGCLPSLSIRGIIQIKADSKFQELFWPGYSRKLAVFLLGANDLCLLVYPLSSALRTDVGKPFELG